MLGDDANISIQQQRLQLPLDPRCHLGPSQGSEADLCSGDLPAHPHDASRETLAAAEALISSSPDHGSAVIINFAVDCLTTLNKVSKGDAVFGIL